MLYEALKNIDDEVVTILLPDFAAKDVGQWLESIYSLERKENTSTSINQVHV